MNPPLNIVQCGSGPNLNLSPFTPVLSPSPTRFLNFILCFVYFIYQASYSCIPFHSHPLSGELSLHQFFLHKHTDAQLHNFFHLQTKFTPFKSTERVQHPLFYTNKILSFLSILCLKIYKMLLLMFFYVF